MINLIIMILAGSAVGVFFYFMEPKIIVAIVFGFATMGLIAIIRSIVSVIRGISAKRSGKLVSERAS